MMRRGKEADVPRRPETPWLMGAAIGVAIAHAGDRCNDCSARDWRSGSGSYVVSRISSESRLARWEFAALYPSYTVAAYCRMGRAQRNPSPIIMNFNHQP